MALSNSQNVYFLIPAAFLFAAAGNSGFVISVFNRRYELMPVKDRILYDNFFSAAVGLAFILGPVTGGAIKKLLESSGWIMANIQFGNIRILYVISAVAITLLQVFITVRKVKRETP